MLTSSIPSRGEKTLPFDQGYLDVGGGHQLYYAQYGQADGQAAVVLHGGPGSGCNPGMLDWFDLSRQRVILFDQRGCGKSLPLGCIENNRTGDVVEDIERLRLKLGITDWLVVGGSWGAVLALTYAACYATAVKGLVLRGAFLASAREVTWFFQELKALVPVGWAQLSPGWDLSQRQSVLATLSGMLLHGSDGERLQAARRWAAYEDAVMHTMLGTGMTAAIEATPRALAKYTIQAHYLSHGCFTSERRLFRYARKVTGIPVIMIHGTHDLVCPPENALRLLRFMPHAQLRWIAKGTHTPADPLVAAALAAAIRDLAATT